MLAPSTNFGSERIDQGLAKKCKDMVRPIKPSPRMPDWLFYAIVQALFVSLCMPDLSGNGICSWALLAVKHGCRLDLLPDTYPDILHFRLPAQPAQDKHVGCTAHKEVCAALPRRSSKVQRTMRFGNTTAVLAEPM